MVEGKVSEPVGETVLEWKARAGDGKEVRLQFLYELPGLGITKIGHVR
jgi:MarR-like DNA-binding transcriptional regulator SgrR of sgrS sRNA